MATADKRRELTPAAIVVSAVGGALLANWIHTGWVSAILGAIVAVGLVAYGLAEDKK